MIDPVICADGVTYERAAITLWLQTENISPVTGQLLKHTDLSPNDRLRASIQAGKERATNRLDRSLSPPSMPRWNDGAGGRRWRGEEHVVVWTALTNGDISR